MTAHFYPLPGWVQRIKSAEELLRIEIEKSEVGSIDFAPRREGNKPKITFCCYGDGSSPPDDTLRGVVELLPDFDIGFVFFPAEKW